MAMTLDQVADEMYKMIAEAAEVKKKLKPMDVTKSILKLHGEEGVDKKLCKAAIRSLIDSGRCVYTYFGGSYIEVPHSEGAANE
ncbi:MAG TPA: hypothetical protein ENI92_00015 [Bacteroidetes bacterium]|nr:hypothetical protein [Bacteroidota bacterium]